MANDLSDADEWADWLGRDQRILDLVTRGATAGEASLVRIDDETLRQATLRMANWLEGRRFEVTAPDGVDPHDATIAAAAWAEGYRRAIFELRWAARPPEQIPDDIAELDP